MSIDHEYLIYHKPTDSYYISLCMTFSLCLCPVVREAAWEQCGPEVQSFACQYEELLQGVCH